MKILLLFIIKNLTQIIAKADRFLYQLLRPNYSKPLFYNKPCCIIFELLPLLA